MIGPSLQVTGFSTMSAKVSDLSLSTAAPGARLTPDAFEILLEALLQIRLECHLWKAHFIHIVGHSFPQDPAGEYQDVWDLMLARAIPSFSPATYQQFAPLFDEALKEARARFEKLGIVYARVLPRHVQKRLAKAARQLEFSMASYRWIPARALTDDPDVLFCARFKAVIRLLRLIARDADERLEAMVPDRG
jgi:hypothetical protein